MIEEKKEYKLYKDYKIIILALVLFISVFCIFWPFWPMTSAENPQTGITNINYGLDIEGGSWIQLKLNGAVAQVDAAPRDIVAEMTKAEFPSGIDITGSSVYENGAAYVMFRTIDPVNKTRLEYIFGTNDISVRQIGGVSEVNITSSKVGFIQSYLTQSYNAEVLPSASQSGVEYEIRTATTYEELNKYMTAVKGSVLKDSSGNPLYRDGATKDTMERTIEVLTKKLGNGLGVKDLPIRAIGNEYIDIDFAGTELNDARALVKTPGKFEMRFQSTGNETVHVLYGDTISSVGIVGQDPNTGVYYVPFTLNEEGAKALQQAAISVGATINPNAHYLIMILDGNAVYSAPLSPDAAAKLNTYPTYSWQASIDSREGAKDLQVHLRSGALPINVEIIGSGQVEATLGQGFLKGAIIIGIISMMVVSLVVYNRYKRPEIAIPMVMTSFSEVIILLGFSIIIKQDLDLAAIAGIIAVIGTGIDHLVIITEEVVHEGKTPSDKVYSARITKAFVIIFGAAATTIIAMSPLLSLTEFGALKGFAITTIAGVFIGVLVARPAYSSILRYILTKRGITEDSALE